MFPQVTVLFSFLNKFILFIYFWLRWIFIATHGLSSSCGEGGLLFVAVRRLQAHALQQLWLVGSRAQAQQLWHMGLVAPQHVGSSWTRARTRVPCIGRQILFFFFLTSLLEYNCFTMVCQFLLHNKVNQLYIYICPHISSLLRLPPSLAGRFLTTAPPGKPASNCSNKQAQPMIFY